MKDSPVDRQASRYGRPMGPLDTRPTIIPGFPENREINREFFGIFGPVLPLSFIFR
jgi:hypothetical protein